MSSSIPHRRCVSCRQVKPQSALLRFHRRGDGELQLTREERKGRGAYVCPTQECVQKSWRGGRWDRAFRARVRPCGDVDVFWAELLSTLVKEARFLYRSPLCSEDKATMTSVASRLDPPPSPSVPRASVLSAASKQGLR